MRLNFLSSPLLPTLRFQMIHADNGGKGVAWAKGIMVMGLLALGVVLLFSAWLCDDAYITFRTVENAATGHGLRWNPIERVQSYTHPLWMLLLVGLRLVAGELYYSTMFLSLTLSLLTAWLILRSAGVRLSGLILALLSLLLSRAFIDYSSSGLEGPLAHLLLVMLIIQWWKILSAESCHRRDVFLVSLLFSGILLCRLDYVLLVGPMVGVLGRKRFPIFPVFLGLTPFLAWEIFSLVYYGSLIPNTAFAKLGGGLALSGRLDQGWTYLTASIRNDPVTGLVLAGSAVFSAVRVRDPGRWAITMGVVLYVGYVWSIGGDFMAGRFLAAPLVVSVMAATRVRLTVWPTAAVAVVLVSAACLGPNLIALSSPRFGQDQYAYLGETGVADERLFYYKHTGLMRQPRGDLPNIHPWVFDGLALRESGTTPVARNAAGFYGYFAGPEITIVDLFGLCDPLLARLPATRQSGWRAGHLEREIPPEYLATVATDSGLAGDSDIARLENRIRLVARGPLFTGKRWQAIWELNTGGGFSPQAE